MKNDDIPRLKRTVENIIMEMDSIEKILNTPKTYNHTTRRGHMKRLRPLQRRLTRLWKLIGRKTDEEKI
ncbi:MAG: hypothetical protein NTY22_08060 [Proteobacteria bacterium]|nr:hypothetical protein [Pseudomonadota bacterium]